MNTDQVNAYLSRGQEIANKESSVLNAGNAEIKDIYDRLMPAAVQARNEAQDTRTRNRYNSMIHYMRQYAQRLELRNKAPGIYDLWVPKIRESESKVNELTSKINEINTMQTLNTSKINEINEMQDLNTSKINNINSRLGNIQRRMQTMQIPRPNTENIQSRMQTPSPNPANIQSRMQIPRPNTENIQSRMQIPRPNPAPRRQNRRRR